MVPNRHHPDGMDVTTSIYSQDYVYDSLGNFLQKDSSQRYIPSTTPKGALNYEQDYTYYEGTPHRVQWIGNIYYSYDKNGNVIEERKGGPSAEAEAGESTLSVDGYLRSVNRGFALMRTEDDDQASTWCRTYTWDEENRLIGFDTTNTQVKYLYDADNMRTSKYNLTASEETLYFDQFYQGVTEGSDFRQSKHIYLGESRVATRVSLEKDNVSGTNFDYERVNTYYYHPDHLGSAQFVTDHEGEKYEHLEYTPYGELWEEQTDPLADAIPFRFTGKEYDEETGLYYYGARYLDPKRGRWMSSDPAMDGMNWYEYGGNNPIYYVDPDGREIVRHNAFYNMSDYKSPEVFLGNSSEEKFHKEGCYITAFANIQSSIELSHFSQVSKSIDTTSPMDLNFRTNLFGENSGKLKGGESMDAIFGQGKWDYWTSKNQKVEGLLALLEKYRDSDKKFMIVGIFNLNDAEPGVTNHMVGINGTPDGNGIFDASDIVPTSGGDLNRLQDENKKKSYSIDNMKEFRAIFLDGENIDE